MQLHAWFIERNRAASWILLAYGWQLKANYIQKGCILNPEGQGKLIEAKFENIASLDGLLDWNIVDIGSATQAVLCAGTTVLSFKMQMAGNSGMSGEDSCMWRPCLPYSNI